MSDDQNDLFDDEFTATMQEMLEQMEDLDVEDLKHLWPMRLIEFYDLISHSLKEFADITDTEENRKNTKISAAMVTTIANYFGGVSFYLPHNEKLDRAVRDIKIYKDFTGNNHTLLAKKHRLSEMAIRNIIAKQYQMRKRKIQPELF